MLGRKWVRPGGALPTCRGPWRRGGFGCFGTDVATLRWEWGTALPLPAHDLQPQAQARMEAPAQSEPENKAAPSPGSPLTPPSGARPFPRLHILLTLLIPVIFYIMSMTSCSLYV